MVALLRGWALVAFWRGNMLDNAKGKLALAAMAALGLSTAANAAPVAPGVAVHFGSDFGGAHSVDGPAGVLGTGIWNNLSGASGGPTALTEHDGDIGSPTVSWASNNTWSSTGGGEENNGFAGEDRDLMKGYLDTTDVSTTSITINGLKNGRYDLYLYILGGTGGRSGDYSVNGVVQHNISQTNPSAFKMSTSLDNVGNYLLFEDVMGPTITITAKAAAPGGAFRAPINGIEVVVPEPGSLSLLGLGAVSLLVRRRKA
jgi:PEP-CTERM motif